MRQLNYTEAAAAESNKLYPLTAVCVLKLQNGPSENALRAALIKLLLVHPLLGATISEKKGNYYFEYYEHPEPIPLRTVIQQSDSHWLDIARSELNRGFSNSDSPLMRAVYLVPPGPDPFCCLVLSFHHAAVDSVSIMEITEQLLNYSEEIELNDKKTDYQHINKDTIPVIPPAVNILPSSFRGIGLYFRLLSFFIRQASEGIKYDRSRGRSKNPDVPDSSENDILTIGFSVEETRSITSWTRKRMISLNGLISAAMLTALNQYAYKGSKSLMRTIQFANLRPYLNPAVNSNEDGCYVASMRFTVPVSPEVSIERCAEELDSQLLRSGRRGDKFLFAVLSRFLVKKTIREHKLKLAETALSYAGPIPLKNQYGNCTVTDVHGFVTNNCLGPEFTAFASIFSGRLNIDINFLTAETTRETALMMAGRVKQELLKITECQ